MHTQEIRWGIMGPGHIAKSFTKELKNATGAIVHAVASRSLERAQAFAQTYSIAHAYGTYEELAADPKIDIVYVATPHPYHKEHTLLCLDAGKAVVCEKPFAMNAREAKVMIDTARRQKLFLMEAMWTRFLPAIRQVKDWIQDGQIGDVMLVQAAFGFKCPWNPEGRLLNRDLGGGSLLDAGIYPVSLASWAMSAQPQQIQSTAHIGQTGVDEWLTAWFDYGDGRAASLSSAIQLPLRVEAVITGTKGRIDIPNFIGAKSATLLHPGASEQTYRDQRTERGMGHEAEEAMRCLRQGLLESPIIPLDETHAIMQTLDRIRSEHNLRFPADED